MPKTHFDLAARLKTLPDTQLNDPQSAALRAVLEDAREAGLSSDHLDRVLASERERREKPPAPAASVWLSQEEVEASKNTDVSQLFVNEDELVEGESANPKSQIFVTADDIPEALNDGADFSTLSPDLSQKHVARSRAHGLGAGETLELNGKAYRIDSILSEGSAEAVIYRVKTGGGKTAVVKLYSHYNDPRREPNGEALKRIQQLDPANILELYDFGAGAQKYEGKYAFEVAEFAAGGDLFAVDDLQKKYTPAFVREHLLPEMLSGIRTLHAQGIYHCDLKPQNIFFRDIDRQDTVIGDYGSAKTVEASENARVHNVSTVIGTDAYLPPEQARNLVSEKNDYYSLGMVLLHLLYPEFLGKETDLRRIDRSKLNTLIRHQYLGEPIITYNPELGALNQLIAGLTMFNAAYRWGPKEVRAWEAGTPPRIRYANTEVIPPVKLGFATLHAPDDLLEVVNQSDTRWYRRLIKDQDGFRQLMDWVSRHRDLGEKRRLEVAIRFNEPFGRAYVAEAIRRFFRPTLPVRAFGKLYNFEQAPELTPLVRAFFSDFDDNIKRATPNALRFTLTQLELSLRYVRAVAEASVAQEAESLLNRIGGLLKMKPLPDEDLGNFDLRSRFAHALPVELGEAPEAGQLTRLYSRFIRLAYEFDGQRAFRDEAGKRYPDFAAVGKFLARNPDAFDDPILRIERGFFLASRGEKAWFDLAYADLLPKLLPDAIRPELEIDRLEVDALRSYRVAYRFRQAIALDTEGGEAISHPAGEFESHELTFRTSAFGSLAAARKHFFEEIAKRHEIDPSQLPEDQRKAAKQAFGKTGRLQLIGHHLKELFPAVVWSHLLFLPALGFFLRDADGTSILAQLYTATQTDTYLFDNRSAPDEVFGMYAVLAWAFAAFLLLLPTLGWKYGPRAIVRGQSFYDGIFAFRPGGAIVYWLMMMLLPVAFSFANELPELAGILLLLVFAWLAPRIGRRVGSKTRWRLMGLILVLGVLVRAGTSIYYLVNEDRIPPFRGVIDWGILGALLVVGFFPALVHHLTRAYPQIQVAIKTALIAGLVVLTLGAGPGFGKYRRANWQHNDFRLGDTASGRAASPSLTSGRVYLARLRSSYSGGNIRRGPEVASGNVVAVLRPGEPVMVEKWPTGAWAQVRTTDGRRGYISAKLLNIPPTPASEEELARAGF